MLPIIVEMEGPEDWRERILRFADSLRNLFGERLLRVIALPDPDMEIYESNVLVVLREAKQEDVMKVMDVAMKVDEKLNPLVLDEGDEDAVNMFIRAGGYDVKTDKSRSSDEGSQE